MDEVVFWGVAYACILAATVAYGLFLWRKADMAALIGRVTGGISAGLMAAGLALRLLRMGRWLPVGGGEFAVAVGIVTIGMFLVRERRGEVVGAGAGILGLVLLLYSWALWSLVVRSETVPSPAGSPHFVEVLLALLGAVAYGCMLVSGGIGLVGLIPSRWSVMARPPLEALELESWRTFVGGASLLSGELLVKALVMYLWGRDLWSPEAGLLGPLAVGAVCGGALMVMQADRWRSHLASLTAVMACLAIFSGGV
ncbi:MAG: hypothetical protein H5T62_05730 [Anaerolineae bacterium]|nr:hypothetical protein [Anaerolineae bacterium]